MCQIVQRSDLYSEALFCIEPLILATAQKQKGQFRTQGVLSDKHGDKAWGEGRLLILYASYRIQIVI